MSNLTQAEIDAMLQGGGAKPEDEKDTAGQNLAEISQYFSPEEIDALGEIGNICIGTSATTMNMLLGHKVTITTPQVSLIRPDDDLFVYNRPSVAVNVEYIEGLHGKNLLILQDYDVALITDLLMGGDGSVDPDHITLDEIHLSAVSEVMNQMIGSAATAMSHMMGAPINISPPNIVQLEVGENVEKYLDGATPVVKVSFDIEIEGLLKSKLIQAMSIEMAKELISALMQVHEEPAENKPVEDKPASAPTPAPTSTPVPDPVRMAAASVPPPPPSRMPAQQTVRSGAGTQTIENERVKTVMSACYPSFDEEEKVQSDSGPGSSNYDLIYDIPLQVTVELGKTQKNLSDILNVGIGSIIVLEKQAGDLVDVIVNGKQIAKGEVVVIDENYGVRITDLINHKP